MRLLQRPRAARHACLSAEVAEVTATASAPFASRRSTAWTGATRRDGWIDANRNGIDDRREGYGWADRDRDGRDDLGEGDAQLGQTRLSRGGPHVRTPARDA